MLNRIFRLFCINRFGSYSPEDFNLEFAEQFGKQSTSSVFYYLQGFKGLKNGKEKDFRSWFSIMNNSRVRRQNRKGFNWYGRDAEPKNWKTSLIAMSLYHPYFSFPNGRKSIAGSHYPSLRAIYKWLYTGCYCWQLRWGITICLYFLPYSLNAAQILEMNRIESRLFVLKLLRTMCGTGLHCTY